MSSRRYSPEYKQEAVLPVEQSDVPVSEIARPLRRYWENLIALFDFPEKIRKVIQTTNAIESLKSVIRKSIKQRKVFQRVRPAFKVVFLAIEQASKEWTMPIRDEKAALNRFMIEFEGRLEA